MLQRSLRQTAEADGNEMEVRRGQAGKATRVPSGSAGAQAKGEDGGGERMADWAASSLLGAMGLEGETERRRGGDDEEAHRIADAGFAGSGGALPHGEAIRRSFGPEHDVSGIEAHIGGAAREATSAMGAQAYAKGNQVAFGEFPSLHTAAHEAAHVMQQRAGVHLKGGVGEAGDAHERHADAVADAVVRGESAASLLSAYVGSGGGGGRAVQRQEQSSQADGSSTQVSSPSPLPFLDPPAPKPGLLPGGIDPNDPLVKRLLGGGGGLLLPGGADPYQLDVGVTPNPLDPFEQPATDWDKLAAPVPGPDLPSHWAGVTYMPKQPLPFLRFDGKPCSRVMPNQKEAADRALAEFERIHAETNASWNAMIPGITSFTEASKDLNGAGVLGSEGGLGWNAGSQNADLGKLTGQQKVGPDGSTKTIDDLFKNKDGSAGTASNVSAPGAHSTKKTKELLNSAKRASNEVRTAVSEHKIAQGATKGTAEGVRAAVLLVEINEAKVEADHLKEKKEELQKDKAEAEEKLDMVVSSLEALTLIGFGIADAASGGIAHGAESIMIGAEIGAEVIGKAIINAKYDDKIEAADKQLKTALSGIRSKQGSYVQAALTSAVIAHDTAMARVRTTRETMLAKVAAYQSAYDQFAEEAGKAAGGGARGSQVQAALEAVPRVEHCLGQIKQITSSIAVPAYTELSGKGFNGFGKPAELVTYVGQMKGYREKFQGLEATWKARLVSLKALEKQLGM